MSDDLTRLTDEEREALGLLVGNGYLTRVGTRVLFDKIESILAARTAALIDRAERAERERDELRESLPKRTNDWLAHCKRLDDERDAVSDQLAGAWKELGRVESELAALRAAVTGLADEWWNQYDGTEPPEHVNLGWAANQLRAVLTDEGDNQ